MSLLVQIEKKLPQFNLSVSFETDGTLGILGGSGAGKSMSLRCIAGLETPTSGLIVLNDRVLFDSAKGINLPTRQRSVGFLFQNYALFPHMTVSENIGFGLKAVSNGEFNRRINEKIAAFRLKGLEDRLPHQLSGGQQQRVALARATIMKPDLLLLDEPFSALDNYLRSQLEKELTEVLDDYEGTTLFVSHNLDEAYVVCQDLMILDNGKKIAYGYKEDIFKNPPNYITAKVTGCKNISRSGLVVSDSIEAIDWGCHLKLARPMPANIKYVGIRSHHVTFLNDLGPENVFPCRLTKASETPFSMNLYLSLNPLPEAGNHYHLQAEVYKEEWNILKDRPFPWLVHLDPEHLFFTSE